MKKKQNATRKPAISVVIPLYNSEHEVKRLVKSLQKQSFDDFEALLVDDGSTDRTAESVIRTTGHDKRFTLLRQENAGPGTARNTGLDAAHGEYVTFFDDDDTPDTKLLEHAYDMASRTKADIVIWQTRHQNMVNGKNYPSPDRWDPNTYPQVFDPHEYPYSLFGSFRNWPWDKLFRRRFLVDESLRFPALYRSEDLAFTCSALACAHRIALLDEELYTYRFGDTTSSTQTLDRAPLDFIESCKLLRSFLEERNLWALYHDSYIQWVGLCVHVNLLGLNTPDAFIQTYRALHEGSLSELGLSKQDPTLFRSDAVADTIDAIEGKPPAEGAFSILHAEIVRMEQSGLQREMEFERIERDILGSRTYRTGKMLLAPARAIRKLNDMRVRHKKHGHRNQR